MRFSTLFTASVGFMVVSPEVQGQCLEWTERATTFQPSQAGGGSMVYDPHHRVTLFLVFRGNPVEPETWLWDGNEWGRCLTSADPFHRPPSRGNPAMAPDSSGGIVLFGGSDGSGGYLGDTWTWHGSSWNVRSWSGGPPASGLLVMAYDEARQVTVLFQGGALNDTWKWLEKDLTLITVPDAGHWVHHVAADFVTKKMVSWLND